MSRTRHRVCITAVVLTACFALCGCALQSSRPASTAGSGGSEGTSANVWRYARTITLDTTAAGANVPDDVVKYPLAVLLDKSRFDFSQARPDGADIRFFDAGGKALPHAIELWDREGGSAAVWVLLDVVKGHSRNQSIVMRWGHPGAPDISDSKAVFKRADGFVGAWHLGEDGNIDPDGYKDSSDHEAHGTGVGMMPGSRVDARIGKGTRLDNPAGHLGGRRQWDGILDEARVMQGARSGSWAKLDYETQRQAPTLLEFGEIRGPMSHPSTPFRPVD